MPPVIVATPGASNANSFGTLEEAAAYFENRLALDPAWVPTGDDAARSLIMATMILSSMSMPHKRIVHEKGKDAYYVVGRYWTGQPATSTQSLAWPRIGMRDSLGREIPVDVIPQELKYAEFELAGQLRKADLTLDNDVSTQGISSIRAGSVSVSFRDNIAAKVLPDYVLSLMPPWWFYEETIEPVSKFMFGVV